MYVPEIRVVDAEAHTQFKLDDGRTLVTLAPVKFLSVQVQEETEKPEDAASIDTAVVLGYIDGQGNLWVRNPANHKRFINADHYDSYDQLRSEFYPFHRDYGLYLTRESVPYERRGEGTIVELYGAGRKVKLRASDLEEIDYDPAH